MKFTFKVSKSAVDAALETVIQKAVEQTTIKGFRQGQAPKNLVIERIGKEKLEQQALETVIPTAYTNEINTRKLKPIAYPKITFKNPTKDQAWEFEAEIAEYPEIKLGKYEDAIKGAGAKSKIWTPDQDKVTQKKLDPQEEADKKLRLIFDALLTTVELEVPSLLVDQEVDRMLSRLLEQLNKLGLDIDAYLTSVKHTKESLREQYLKTATESLKIEFILQEIAKDMKLAVSDKEIDDFIATIGDEKTKQRLNNPLEKANIKTILTKQQTLQKLQQLVV